MPIHLFMYLLIPYHNSSCKLHAVCEEYARLLLPNADRKFYAGSTSVIVTLEIISIIQMKMIG